MKKSMLFLLSISMLCNSGCATRYMLKSNQSEIANRRAMASGDPLVIRAVQNGDFYGVGVDLLSLDNISESPGKLSVALALDGLVLNWLRKEVEDYIDDSDEKKDIIYIQFLPTEEPKE